jgi:hypothetical protein
MSYDTSVFLNISSLRAYIGRYFFFHIDPHNYSYYNTFWKTNIGSYIHSYLNV